MITKFQAICTISKILLFGAFSLSVVSSCATLKYNDVHTGVLLYGREIVVLDRNIGAKSQNASGKYLRWEKANISCPEGYHLMRYDEAMTMVHNERYGTPAELIHSDMALAPYGFIARWRKLQEYQETGYYHLTGMIAENESWYLRLNENDSTAVFGINYKRKHKDRMSARCVKDYDR